MTHSDPLFKILGVVKINGFNIHQISTFVYKYNANMLPINVINCFTNNSAVHVHNTRSADDFHLSCSYSTLRLNNIRHAGPHIWNNLLYGLKVACSLYVFNRKMKSLLMRNYYIKLYKIDLYEIAEYVCNIN